MMINPKKVMKLAKKWQQKAAINRKQITFRPFRGTSSSLSIADEGHFIAYTADKNRYVFPIAYLTSYIFRELLRLSEEEYGLPGNGPIVLPCDAMFMDYTISLMRRGSTGEDVQKALVISMADRCSLYHYSLLHQQGGMEMEQSLIYGF